MPTVPPKTQRIGIIQRQITKGNVEIRDILLQARDRIDLKILKAAQEKNFLTAATTRDTLYAGLQKEYIAMQGKVDDWTRRTITNTARQWRKLAIADLPRGKYNQTWSQFSHKYLEDMIARINPINAPRLAGVNAAVGGMLQADIQHLRKQVIEVYRLGAATGLTAEQTRKELLARVTGPRPAWQFIDKAGKKWDTKNYFNMLDRTIVANAARSSYMDTMTEAGYDLAQIEGGITAESLRYPSDPCPEWAGKIISITGATKGYPTYDEALDAGMFHPRCRHYLGAIMPDEMNEAREKQAREAEQAREAREAAETEKLQKETRKEQAAKREAKEDRAAKVVETNAERAAKAGAMQQAEAAKTFANDKEAQAWADKNFAQWEKGLDGMEFKSLTYYQGSGYEEMNKLLRGGKQLSGKWKTIETNVDKAIAKTSTDRNITVFRGFNHPDISKNFDNLIGATIQDKAYVSTSLSENIAKRFQKESKGVIAEIKLPKGSKGAWLGGLGDASESEFLLPRNSKFQITATRMVGKVKYVTMELLA